MRASARLALYGGLLVAVFAVAFATAGAVVPEETVRNWVEESDDHGAGHGGSADADEHADADHGGASAASGLTLESGGYRLTDLSAPAETGEGGELSLSITDAQGQAVTDFDLSHEKELHLIAVRSDGEDFRHVHPERDDDGQWSTPWEWEEAGDYRIFTEFVPAEAGEAVTLSSTVQIPGQFEPETVDSEVRRARTDDFEVSVDGALTAGETSALTMTVSSDAEPVTGLEPYLGAYGHLVALREGDLAFLHVHPHGEGPKAGQTSGPEVAFEVTAPTVGRYLLYLDFQVDGEVHTAELVLDAEHSGGTTSSDASGGPTEQSEGESHDHGE